MKKVFFILFISSIVSISFAQKKAVIAESGLEVNLFDDGTWKYVFDDPSGSIKIDTTISSKPKSSDFLLESSKLKYGVWMNNKKWTFNKNKDEGDTPMEFGFKLKGEDAYGMIISERIEIPMDNLIEIAFQNASKAASDAKIVKQGVRIVNGVTVNTLILEGTMKGIKFVYLGYYYSDGDGSIQFVTYTSKNLFNKYKPEMESLLNGFIIKK